MGNKIRLAILFFIFFICLIHTQAEEQKDLKIGINQIIPTVDAERYSNVIRYPNLKAYVSVRDKTDTPIPLLMKSNFDLAIDGKPSITNIEVENFYYAKKEKGVAFFVLINASGVMMGNPLETQKKSVKLFIDQMREEDTISLYSYGEKLNTVFEYQARDDQLYDLIDAIEIEAGSAPKLLDHLQQVARQTHNKDNKLIRNIIIALSEGRDSDSMFNEEKLFEFVDEKSIPIYSVLIPIPFRVPERLDRLAQHTGGVYMFTSKMSEISEKLKQIYKQVLESYVVEFRVTMKGDDDYHNLQINLNHKGNEALATKIFYSRKAPPTPWWLIILILIIIIILALAAGVFIVFIGRGKQRKKAGTAHKKKCKECGRIQKDDWNECLFCKYLPLKKKEKT